MDTLKISRTHRDLKNEAAFEAAACGLLFGSAALIYLREYYRPVKSFVDSLGMFWRGAFLVCAEIVLISVVWLIAWLLLQKFFLRRNVKNRKEALTFQHGWLEEEFKRTNRPEDRYKLAECKTELSDLEAIA